MVEVVRKALETWGKEITKINAVLRCAFQKTLIFVYRREMARIVEIVKKKKPEVM